ncbi:MAG: hypothetical protein QNJ32_17550 [Xenococcaceae cyanobacterium MO_167.B27]|nr:hypothetical protein [Xenococcaceae cyanobacterium MO_167.B27]
MTKLKRGMVVDMEANNIKQENLVGVIGSRGVVSEVVNGKRSISKAQAFA